MLPRRVAESRLLSSRRRWPAGRTTSGMPGSRGSSMLALPARRWLSGQVTAWKCSTGALWGRGHRAVWPVQVEAARSRFRLRGATGFQVRLACLAGRCRAGGAGRGAARSRRRAAGIRSASTGSAGCPAAHSSRRAALSASNSFSRSRSAAACSSSGHWRPRCRSRRTLSICSSRSLVSGPVPTRCSTAASRSSTASRRACTSGHGAPSSAGLRASCGSLPWYSSYDDLLAYPVQVGAQPDQHLRGHAVALTDEAQQDVLGADVVVAELQRLAQRQLRAPSWPAGVNGMCPDGICWPWPMISSTCARTASRLMPSDSSALAATPSPSWMRPSRMCSVPT